MASLDDQVAVVTGGSSGIGRAIAQRLAADGATVVVADIRETPRESGVPTHRTIEEAGGTATFVKTDVTDKESVFHVVHTAVNQFGKLDVMVNNAGIFPNQQDVTKVNMDTYEHVMDVNLRGVYLGCQAAIERMQSSRGGAIVNTSSIAGLMGYDQSSVYCASKGGVTNLTRELAVEQGPNGIRVNAVNPGIIETAQTRVDEEDVIGEHVEDIPLRRDGLPEDVASVVSFLASDDAAYVTGQNLVVDGGLTVS